MRTYKDQAIVLKKENFKESDRIITLFSPSFGKLRLLARGVRKITSKRSADLELFCVVRFVAHKGKVLDVIAETVPLFAFPQIRKDLRRIATCFELVEVLDKLVLEKQEHQEIYNALLWSLQNLNAEKISATRQKQIVFRFKRFLLIILGFWSKFQPITTANIDEVIEEIIQKPLRSSKVLRGLYLNCHSGEE